MFVFASRTWAGLGLLLLLGVACISEDPSPPAEPTGPAEIRHEVLRQHAREFRTDLADRRPGSQGEQAAAAYILGHLQQAGYVVQLDGVPVHNLVRSTNLIARPPSGGDPEVVLAVPYGRGKDRRGGDLALGLFLELARALRVTEPDHSVEFIALGAEGPGLGDEDLGSRRLAKTLLDDGLDPLVITLYVPPGEGQFYADPTRSPEGELVRLAIDHGLRTAAVHGPRGAHVTVLTQAGLDHLRISGPEQGTGEVLLEYLADYSS